MRLPGKRTGLSLFRGGAGRGRLASRRKALKIMPTTTAAQPSYSVIGVAVNTIAAAYSWPAATDAPIAPKTIAVPAAPVVWPVRRTDARTPAALPALLRGALPMSSRLFGDWKKPKPIPQMAPCSKISTADAPGRTVAYRPKPRARIPRPIVDRMPAGYLSLNRPAIGATIMTAMGHDDSNRPDSNGDFPSAAWK